MLEFGVLLPATPPWERLVRLARRAEDLGFDYVWISDTHVLRYSPWPIFALIARATERIRIGVNVTNPGTRDPTETASLLATLDQISGGRMVCGMGRGDSARRTIGLAPIGVARTEAALKIVKDLASGREVIANDVAVRLAWASGRELEMWGAAFGPRMLAAVGRTCDGFILELADPLIFTWMAARVREAALAAGRDGRAAEAAGLRSGLREQRCRACAGAASLLRRRRRQSRCGARQPAIRTEPCRGAHGVRDDAYLLTTILIMGFRQPIRRLRVGCHCGPVLYSWRRRCARRQAPRSRRTRSGALRHDLASRSDRGDHAGLRQHIIPQFRKADV